LAVFYHGLYLEFTDRANFGGVLELHGLPVFSEDGDGVTGDGELGPGEVAGGGGRVLGHVPGKGQPELLHGEADVLLKVGRLAAVLVVLASDEGLLDGAGGADPGEGSDVGEVAGVVVLVGREAAAKTVALNSVS
jgi:hypothetical protein